MNFPTPLEVECHFGNFQFNLIIKIIIFLSTKVQTNFLEARNLTDQTLTIKVKELAQYKLYCHYESYENESIHIIE